MKMTVETLVNAAVAKVWSAYTTPEDIKQWNRASDDWHTTTSTVDLRVLAVALVAATLGLHSGLSQATESAGPPAMAPMAAPPAGAYKLDKSHASLVLRASHMGFSTYTTRFSRFDVDLTFDPRNLPASRW